jgi:hypothetical protein
VTTVEGLATTFETTQRQLTEVGILIMRGPSGAGITSAHVASTGSSKEDRAKAFQTGTLAPEHRPRTLNEAVELLCEGIPDNGRRSTADPDDPVRQMLSNNLPFPGYHPSNPRHIFEVVARNMIAADRGIYFRPHMHPDLQPHMEWTGNAAIAQVVPFVLPTIRQVWQRLLFMQLVSTQPMTKPTGEVVYLNFLYDPSGGDPSQQGEFVSDYAQYISEQEAMKEVKLTLTKSNITMDTKKLRAEWSTEARQDLYAGYGLDIAGELINFMADEIAREVNALFINQMLLAADPNGVITAGNVNFGCTMPAAGYQNQTEWDRKLYQFMLRGDGLIRAARRARANWAVCGSNAIIRLQSLQNFVMTTQDAEARDWNIGLNLVGTLQGEPNLKVYSCDADFMNSETILLGRKGPEWYDAGMVYCPYIPLFTTAPFINDKSFCESEAAMSRFGYKKIIGGAFATVTCQPGVQGVDWV